MVDGRDLEAPPLLCGLRTVEMMDAPDRFGFLVNGIPVFMQGGNRVPCDALYGRITPAKVARLVEEAAAAGFNCLRIWGGGRFEMDAFYDACDRLGILVWHDFMSACAPLPAHEEWFADEFRREAEHQVRRLRSRACLLLWCGNNEVSACYEWMSNQFRDSRDPGWSLYHRLLPRLVRDLSPHVPCRPTSPYGGKHSLNDAHTGDDHHWVVMRPEPRFWFWPEYWDSPDRSIFNSEYGYGGPCCPESAREYLGAAQPRLRGDVAREHTNTFYNLERVDHSIREHYGEPSAWRHCRFREMGLPPARLSLERTDAAGGDRTVTIRSETYAHAVHFRIPGDYRLSDHYFDLLPGETRVVTIYGGAGLDPRALTPHCVAALAGPPTA